MRIEILCHFDLLRAKNLPNVTIQFAEGFALNKNEVKVVAPYVYRKNNIKINDVYVSYGVKKIFKLKILKTLIFEKSYKHYILMMLILVHFIRSIKLLLMNLFAKRENIILISTLSYILVPYIFILKKIMKFNHIKIVPWEHEFHKRKWEIWVYKNSDGILVTNSTIKNDLINEFDISGKKIFVTFNPISSSRLQYLLSKEEIRNRLKIDKVKLVVYTGKIGIRIKEIYYIIEAASLLPEYYFILTGGKPEVIKYFNDFLINKRIKNIIFTGFLYNYSEIKYYQLSADVLIAYYSKHDIDVKYNLPAKIGEYMTTGNPIVTVNHPATRDILNNDNVLFVEPDDSKALADGIKKIIENPELAHRLAQKAYMDVEKITFEKVTKRINEFFDQI